MKSTLLISSLFLTFLMVGCGGPGGNTQTTGGPLLIKIDPKDRARFDAIRNAPISERKKRQVEFLQSHGHDLEWFPETVGEIATTDTVQIVYFGYDDYVTGFCSGKFLSDNFVATAGHCQSDMASLARAGAPCEDNVLIAYKGTKTGPLEYYSCEKVAAFSFDKTVYESGPENGTAGPRVRRQRLSDYALLELKVGAGAPARPSVRMSADWLKSTGSLPAGDALLALVVDPPKAADSYASKLDVVVGKIVTEASALTGRRLMPTDGDYIESVANSVESGNSGGPFYRLAAQPKLKGRGAPALFSDVLTYVGPVHGHYPSHPIMVIPHPRETLETLFSAAFPGGVR